MMKKMMQQCHLYPRLLQFFLQLLIACRRVHPHQKMEAPILAADGNVRGEGTPSQLENKVVSHIAIMVLLSSQVLFIVTLLYESGQSQLLYAGDRAGVKSQLLSELLHQIPWENHVADAQRGREGFCEGVQVNYVA